MINVRSFPYSQKKKRVKCHITLHVRIVTYSFPTNRFSVPTVHIVRRQSLTNKTFSPTRSDILME